MDISTLTATEIVAIPLTEPERLFGKPDLIPDRYKMLARKWHPDHIGGDDDVFKHINVLHDRAKEIADAGTWHIPGELTFTSEGKRYNLKYFKSFDFELGKAYLSATRVTYVIRKEFADLAENARDAIKRISYPDLETEKVMARYMPTLKGYYETADSVVIMIDKPSDLIRMRDLYDYLGGKVDPTHVAWMISRMLNHASLFEIQKITHNDLSMDTLFVCPEMHTVCVLGGWWYSVPAETKPKALPQRTINNAPSEVLKTKKASLKTDLELARLTGREMLGNANGIHLVADHRIPKPMVNWLRLSSNGSALQDYTHWREHVLKESFGPRKFVKLLVSAADVYPPA